MTRINCVPVVELTDKHLVAEYRELPRVVGLVKRAIARGETPDLSGVYTLGTGHVRFFYPRLKWLIDRYSELVDEMINRGMKPQFNKAGLVSHASAIPQEWWNDWTPSPQAIEINRARIRERLG